MKDFQNMQTRSKETLDNLSFTVDLVSSLQNNTAKGRDLDGSKASTGTFSSG
jgi:hypothetical protein